MKIDKWTERLYDCLLPVGKRQLLIHILPFQSGNIRSNGEYVQQYVAFYYLIDQKNRAAEREGANGRKVELKLSEIVWSSVKCTRRFRNKKKMISPSADVSSTRANRNRSTIFYTNDLIHFICRVREFIFARQTAHSVCRALFFLSLDLYTKSEIEFSKERARRVPSVQWKNFVLLRFFFPHFGWCCCCFCVQTKPNINKINGKSK